MRTRSPLRHDPPAPGPHAAPEDTATPAAPAAPLPARARDPVPLVVDLDGTLARSDLLVEALGALLKRAPHCLLRLPRWWLRGRAVLKAEIASRARLDCSSTPLNEDLVVHLEREKARGRTLVLATGAHEGVAHAIADRVGFFDEVIATTATRNLTSEAKRDALVERFGERGFDYAGNERADYPAWRSARRAIVVDAPARVVRWTRENADVERLFERDVRGRVRAWARALRVHQWLKNLLLFVPLVTALRFTDAAALLNVGIGFVAFGLCASSAYLLNDIADLADDRHHPSKRFRPFAAGELPLRDGLVAIPILLAAAALLASMLPWQFGAVLAGYYATTLAYSFQLKRIEVLDVVALAMLYTTRVFAGGAAAGIALSFWLLAFSTFVFLSLALAKRCAELAVMRRCREAGARGRGYRVADLPLLYGIGTAASYVAALVLALYVNSPQVEHAYSAPAFLWAFVPLLVYWTTRLWLKTYRGELDDDPVVFAIRDPASRVVALLFGGFTWLAL